MPAPMVPPPTIPIWRSGRGLAPFARAILPAVRSAKNTWRRLADCGPDFSARKLARSASKASSAGLRKDNSTASIAASGAICPLVRRLILSFMFLKPIGLPGPAGSLELNGWGQGCSPANSAMCNAARSRSPSTNSSTSPYNIAVEAEICSPSAIISSARLAAIRRGSLTVPPAPGIKPNLTSGNPK